jgi:pyrroline-5-carboxylate reductase
METHKVGTTFVGGGNMATALIGGMLARGRSPGDFCIVEPLAEQRQRLATRFPGTRVIAAIDARAVESAALVVLAVKPQQMHEVAGALAPHLAAGAKPAILTIAAGIRLADLARWLGTPARLVRAMPNTPALIGQGISGLFSGPGTDQQGYDLAVQVLEAAGQVIRVEREEMLDAITGVSGSGPAYVFYFLEACEDAALELGFSSADARQLAYATFAGAIALAQQSDAPPATLRAQVTSKKGTTERAIGVLDAGAVKAKIIDAVLAAKERATELGDELGAAN